MSQYLCTRCGYVYDEESTCKGVFFEEINGEIVEGVIDSTGNDDPFTSEINGELTTGVIERDDKCLDLEIFPGTKWEDVPDSFHCPRCKAEKNKFRKITR
jgi:rubredoxin